MTVEEAKTKVCPFIQHMCEPYPNERSRKDLRNIKCICGDCMAWKWEVVAYDQYTPLTLSTTEGYCARIGQ